MRKLATARVVKQILPIDGADSIELAKVDGWQVVVRKGEFQSGDVAIYCEIDSFIPHTVAPFLTKDKPKVFNGVEGNKLKTIKLRNTLSQGLLLKPHRKVDIGEDLSDELNIHKWEPEIPTQLQGMIKGNFPSFLPKTDVERIQNLGKYYTTWVECGASFEVTEKLEGSSMTAYLKDGVFGVCSRNIDLKEADGNTFWEVAKAYKLKEKLEVLAKHFDLPNVAIQGELIGPKVQGNIYKLEEHQFRLFDIYDIDKQIYLIPETRQLYCEQVMLTQVPIIQYQGAIWNPLTTDKSMDAILNKACGKSVLAETEREGLVFKSCYPNGPRFKVISNSYLLGGK